MWYCDTTKSILPINLPVNLFLSFQNVKSIAVYMENQDVSLTVISATQIVLGSAVTGIMRTDVHINAVSHIIQEIVLLQSAVREVNKIMHPCIIIASIEVSMI